MTRSMASQLNNCSQLEFSQVQLIPPIVWLNLADRNFSPAESSLVWLSLAEFNFLFAKLFCKLNKFHILT